MDEELKEMKKRALETLHDAEVLMHEYACNCEVGDERSRAFEIYENIRTAARVN